MFCLRALEVFRFFVREEIFMNLRWSLEEPCAEGGSPRAH